MVEQPSEWVKFYARNQRRLRALIEPILIMPKRFEYCGLQAVDKGESQLLSTEFVSRLDVRHAVR